MTNRDKLIGGALLLVAAFVGGRYSAPVKIEERVKVEKVVEVQTVEKERIVYREAKKKRTEERKNVDGSSVTVTTEESDTGAIRDYSGLQLSWGTERQESSRVVDRARPGWRLSLGAGFSSLSLRPDLYRLELSRRLVGTVWLGAWAATDRTAGLALALEF